MSENNHTCFLILYHSETGERLARIVIESLRAFGGPLAACPVWAFLPEPDRVSGAPAGLPGVHLFPLAIEDGCPPYPFADKVCACARAETIAGPEIRSLAWLSLDCLVINPPVLFDVGPAPDIAPADAAFRPVHHRNIGSLVHEPADNFWQVVYRALGVGDMAYTIQSFADGQTLRPYFNTHCFALNPAAGLGRAWWTNFKALMQDEAFQAGPCRDEIHRTFLHQAVLSTLVAQMLPWERIRLLPPEYNYPLNLLKELPADLRPAALNDLVNAVYEDAFPWGEIAIREPLRAWLTERLPR